MEWESCKWRRIASFMARALLRAHKPRKCSTFALFCVQRFQHSARSSAPLAAPRHRHPHVPIWPLQERKFSGLNHAVITDIVESHHFIVRSARGMKVSDGCAADWWTEQDKPCKSDVALTSDGGIMDSPSVLVAVQKATFRRDSNLVLPREMRGNMAAFS
jgi:hypothetical protein